MFFLSGKRPEAKCWLRLPPFPNGKNKEQAITLALFVLLVHGFSYFTIKMIQHELVKFLIDIASVI